MSILFNISPFQGPFSCLQVLQAFVSILMWQFGTRVRALCPDDLRKRLQSNVEVQCPVVGARNSSVGSGNALQVVRARLRIPDSIIGSFHWHNPSGREKALRSTQPLTEMSTRNTSWGKGSRCVGLTTLPLSCADCHEIWEPQPPGTLRACPGL